LFHLLFRNLPDACQHPIMVNKNIYEMINL
jgi:hypothetical protein